MQHSCKLDSIASTPSLSPSFQAVLPTFDSLPPRRQLLGLPMARLGLQPLTRAIFLFLLSTLDYLLGYQSGQMTENSSLQSLYGSPFACGLCRSMLLLLWLTFLTSFCTTSQVSFAWLHTKADLQMYDKASLYKKQGSALPQGLICGPDCLADLTKVYFPV